MPFPPPGDLTIPRIKPTSPTLADGFFTTEPSAKPERYISLNKYSIPYQAFTLLLFTLVWVLGFLFCSIDFFIICCDAYIVSYFTSGNPFKLAHLSFCPILLYFLFFWHNTMFPAHVVFSLPQCCKWPFPQGIGLPNIIEINKVNLHFR